MILRCLRHFHLMVFFRPLIALNCLTLLMVTGVERPPKADRVCAEPSASQAAEIRAGIALHDGKKYKEAIGKYQQVLAEEPWVALALHELAYTFFESGRHAEALETAQRGARCRGALQPRFHILMGNALDVMGKKKEAVAVYGAAMKANPQLALLPYNLAISLQRAGRLVEAKRAAERSLTLNPEHPCSHALLADLYTEMGYRIPAILAYTKFLQLRPGC